MSEDAHKKIVAFLAGEFARTEGRACMRFDLAPAPNGSRGEPLRNWDRAESPDLFEGQAQVESLATEILTIAEDYADSYGRGQHRFILRTYQHLGGRSRLAFRVQIDDDGDGDGDDVGRDPPTATGLVGQLMRHNEVKEKTILTLVQSYVGGTARIMTDLVEENRTLRADRRDHLREIEAAKNGELDREMAAAAQVAADDRKDKALHKLYELLPIVKARLLSNGKPGGTSPDENPAIVLARALKESFSSDQLQAMSAILKPQQLLLMGELIRLASEPPADSSTKAKTA